MASRFVIAFLFATLAQSGQVLVMRHCSRGPYVCDRHPPLPPDDSANCLNDFSQTEFPSKDEWGSPAGQCTPAGLLVAKALGKSMKSKLNLSAEVRVRGDHQARCLDTAAALGINTSGPVESAQNILDPLSRVASCQQPNWTAAVAANVKVMQHELKERETQLQALQDVLGRGSARSLTEIPNRVYRGHLVGGIREAGLLVQTFILERTSALPVAWGKLSDEQLMGFQPMAVSWIDSSYSAPEIAKRYASGTLMEVLKSANAESTNVLVGHDTTLSAIRAVLGLEWQCGPWAANGLQPLAGLLFDYTEAGIRIQAVCQSLENGPDVLAVAPANFKTSGLNSMSHKEFEALVHSTIDLDCISSEHGEDKSASETREAVMV